MVPGTRFLECLIQNAEPISISVSPQIRITHSLVVPLKGRNYNSEDLDGKLLDRSGNKVDPCSGYDSAKRQCPASVKESFTNRQIDEFPVRTLLHAAGINDIDSK